MTWVLLLVWVSASNGFAAGTLPIAAPTQLGPFPSERACQHATGQVLAMASDMRAERPVRDVGRVHLVHWRCIEVRQ